jgi:hypothetical protein
MRPMTRHHLTSICLSLLALAACSSATPTSSAEKEGEAAALADTKTSEANSKQACEISGNSIDQDRAGLNVRAEPNGKAAILGKLLPIGDPESHHDHDLPASKKKNIPEQHYFGPGFTITAVSGDWLKIDRIEPVTEGIDPKTGDEWVRKNFQGTGWVHWSKVQPRLGGGPTYAPAVHAYKGPSFDSGKTLHNAGTNLYGIDHVWTDVPRILECQGTWARIEFTQYGESDPNSDIWTSYPAAKRKKVSGWMTGG